MRTTHLVAAKSGTEKVRQARRMKGVKIVLADCLWCCQERWEHVDERLFLSTLDQEIWTKIIQ